MGYDWDVIVVGGGPAGISAAIRARWVKQYKVIPCSTILIENSYLGGMAGWRGCRFTGPSWKIEGTDIVRNMLLDMQKFHIPVYRDRVTRINIEKDIKEVYTAEGKVFRSLAVIIATGIKVLVNEKDYLGCGLEVTSMGYEFIASCLRELLCMRWEPRLTFVGSPKLHNLIPLIRELNTAGSPLTFIIEEDGEESGDIIKGWVEGYWGNGFLKGIRLQTNNGRRDIMCGKVILDCNSYELAPRNRIIIDGKNIGSPFIDVDLDMQTCVPGVLAAGDATAGGYNSFSRAVSQGIIAGLSAYRYVYQKKFNIAPPLFAYRPTDFTLSPDFQELPSVAKEYRPKSIASGEEIKAVIGDCAWLTDMLDGSYSIEKISTENNIPIEKLQEMLKQLVEKKLVTFHMPAES